MYCGYLVGAFRAKPGPNLLFTRSYIGTKARYRTNRSYSQVARPGAGCYCIFGVHFICASSVRSLIGFFDRLLGFYDRFLIGF